MSVSSPAFPLSAPFAGRRHFVRQTLAVSSAARFSGRIRANGSEGGGGMGTTEDPWQTSTGGSTTTDDTSVEVSTTDGWGTTVVSTTAPGPVVRSGPAANHDFHVGAGASNEPNSILFNGKNYGLKLRANPTPSGVHPSSLTLHLTVESWEVGSNEGVASSNTVTLAGSLNSPGAFSTVSAPEDHLKGYHFNVPNSGIIAEYLHDLDLQNNERWISKLVVTAEIGEDDATADERELEIHLIARVWEFKQNRIDSNAPWQNVDGGEVINGLGGHRLISGVREFKDG